MYIKVKVFPKSKKEKVEKVSEDHFILRVKEKAEKNLANKRVIELIANEFRIPVGKVRIINGHHSPNKLLNVGIEPTG